MIFEIVLSTSYINLRRRICKRIPLASVKEIEHLFLFLLLSYECFKPYWDMKQCIQISTFVEGRLKGPKCCYIFDLHRILMPFIHTEVPTC